ncbi:MAG: hypothetical protein V4645_27875 [Pseudomonadota bacterium]
MSPFAPSATWGRNWIGPYEGAFTLAQKYGWANASSLSQLGRVFGISSVSYKKGTRYNTLLADIAAPSALKPYFLSSWAGQWTHLLASDEHFRYCPECIKLGYQSYLFQLRELARCPIHGCDLLDVCTKCGGRTCEYAMTYRAFDTPMQCYHCGTPWSGSLEISKWSETWRLFGEYRSLERLHEWLKGLKDHRIFTSATFPEGVWRSQGASCFGTSSRLRANAHDNEFQCKVAFCAARSISEPTPDIELLRWQDGDWRFVTLEVSENLEKVEKGELQNLKQLYKCIRRNFERKYLRDRKQALLAVRRRVLPGPHIDQVEDELVEAFLWWRRSFEANFSSPGLSNSAAYLRTVLGDAYSGFFAFFRHGFINQVDSSRNVNLRLYAMLFSASFYSACYWTLAYRTKMLSAAHSPNSIRSWSDCKNFHMFSTAWGLQLESPFWVRTVRAGDQTPTQLLATFTGTPEAVIALKRLKSIDLSTSQI